ncbi:hypothetical protein BLNAU_21292 [Blattamonas nauphoetae]|uniref:Uncharacterized protein n=1 Tax=Blattamonas nauphoetae TaxID=2049346 RepID=A0ABQ9WWA5_9EUKA|nr:hypothetical protein BLNAU_21292 [Blattamonas nauphoetae]
MWCRTTSKERPSSSQRHPSPLSSNAVFEHETYDGSNETGNVNRQIITTITNFEHCKFKNMIYNTSEWHDGGSALIILRIMKTCFDHISTTRHKFGDGSIIPSQVTALLLHPG